MTAAAEKIERSEVNQAVRSLRAHFGDSQQAFAQRLGIAIASAVRYEQPGGSPGPRALVTLAELAHGEKLYDLAEILNNALALRVGTVAIRAAEDAYVQVMFARASFTVVLNGVLSADDQQKFLTAGLDHLKIAEDALKKMTEHMRPGKE